MIEELVTPLRLGIFCLLLLSFGILESVFPRRHNIQSKKTRWLNHLGLAAFNTFFIRVFAPLIPIELAFQLEQKNLGIFNVLEAHFVIEMLLSLLVLDLVIYWQHRLMHKVPILWQFHQMHHSDTELDVTSGIRFHPIEMIFSILLKLLVISLFGLSAVVVLVFELLLNGTSLFNHSNVKLVPGMDVLLRLFLVTPDMHRVHHSVHSTETNSNFGFNLSWWDRLFGTYRAQPALGHESMTLGLNVFRGKRFSRIYWLLTQPFINKT